MLHKLLAFASETSVCEEPNGGWWLFFERCVKHCWLKDVEQNQSSWGRLANQIGHTRNSKVNYERSMS